jgi:hypothetical protein
MDYTDPSEVEMTPSSCTLTSLRRTNLDFRNDRNRNDRKGNP